MKCDKCGKKYTNIYYKWCKPCRIDIFTNSISGNEKIDNFIQEIRLNVQFNDELRWIPYNQFNRIIRISESKVTTIYSAIWKDGPLCYDYDKKEWVRRSNKEVILKYLYNSQSITDEFLNEVWYFHIV